MGISEEDIGAVLRESYSVEERLGSIVERNNRAFESAEDLADRGSGRGHRTPAFHMALELRYFWGDIPAHEAVAKAEELLQDQGGWNALPDHDVWGNEYDPCDAFAEAWDDIDEALAPAAKPADAVPLADTHPLTSRRWPSQRHAKYRRAASVAYWYARMLDSGGHFYLAGSTLAGLLDVSQPAASGHLKRLVREGLLEVREKGRQGRANRYVFLFEAVAHEPAEVVEFDRGEATA